MAAIYNNHEPVTHTLEEFSTRASRLCEAQDYDALTRFVLTGEYLDDEALPKQAFLDPIQNLVTEGHPLRISRDYDSVIGFSEDILVDSPISVFSVPHPTFALTTSIHLTRTITYQGQATEVEYHRIPNFEFGSFGPRHHLHIFFPRLWTPERSRSCHPSRLTDGERNAWYVNGIRPAIRQLLGNAVVDEWPATCSTEAFRARRANGMPAPGSKMLQRDIVDRFMDQVRAELFEDPFLEPGMAGPHGWMRDFFVMHTIRGVKHTTSHQANAVSAEHFLADMFKDAKLGVTAHALGEWYIDVGIQIFSDYEQPQCLQWATSSHSTIVSQALQIPMIHAERITRIGSSKYSRDLASHLTAISSFRITPGVQAQGPFEVAYIQAYTTDKAVVYNPDGTHHAKFLTTREVLGPVQPCKNIEGIHDIYAEAAEKNGSSARLEVRVPYEFAAQVLLEFDPGALRGCLCVFSTAEWWTFRVMRLVGISQIISLQQAGPSDERFIPESLLLTAACVWLFNGLHARPDDGPASRNLMEAVLPVTEADDLDQDVLAFNIPLRPAWQDPLHPDPQRVPFNPYGCVFFRRIMVNTPVPRMRYGGPELSESAFHFWFNADTPREVQGKYQDMGIIDRDAFRARRPTTAKCRMPLYVNFTGEEEPNLFNLDHLGDALAPPIEDNASDVPDRRSPSPEHVPQDTDTRLSALWRQFVCDLTSKSPNPRGYSQPSYVRLNEVECRSGSEAPYMNLRLSEVFRAVHYRCATEADWRTSFNWLFPPSGSLVTPASQGYTQSPYFREWFKIMDQNRDNPALIERIRDELFSRILTWSWMPFSNSDKMWSTSAKKKCADRFIRWPPAPNRPPAPLILLKMNARPEFPDVED